MGGSLKQKIEEDVKTSLKAGEALKVSVLRMALGAAHNREIQLLKKGSGLSDEEVLEVVRGEVKKRKDASEEFKKGGREDLVKKELAEAEILSAYLPPEISEDELLRILKDGVREAGAAKAEDFGKVMKIVMPILKGKASGDRISSNLKRLLG